MRVPSSLLGFPLMLVAAGVMAAGVMVVFSQMHARSLMPFAIFTLVLMAGVFVMIRAIRP